MKKQDYYQELYDQDENRELLFELPPDFELGDFDSSYLCFERTLPNGILIFVSSDQEMTIWPSRLSCVVGAYDPRTADHLKWTELDGCDQETMHRVAKEYCDEFSS